MLFSCPVRTVSGPEFAFAGGTTKVMPPIALWDYSWDRALLCSQVIEISRTAADTPTDEP